MSGINGAADAKHSSLGRNVGAGLDGGGSRREIADEAKV